MNSNRKISGIVIVLLGIVTGLAGLLFKVMHWPGAKVMMTTAVPVMIAGVVLLLVRSGKDQ